ncbi:hypothetical protein SDC9_105713 [bioreactor metagenome]|uniref:Uncharacterized protein n=2 Tax=root TaxID=1 RepID=A0A645B0C4_9ZZZZ
MSVLLSTLPGLVLTVALLARVVNWVFQKHYSIAFHGILGVVIASTLVIIPVRYGSAGELALSALCAGAGFLLAFGISRLDRRTQGSGL